MAGRVNIHASWNCFIASAKCSIASMCRSRVSSSVGFHGVSYMAINSLMTAAQKPQGLKALFPVVPMADAYRDTFLNGGQMNTDFVSLAGMAVAFAVSTCRNARTLYLAESLPPSSDPESR